MTFRMTPKEKPHELKGKPFCMTLAYQSHRMPLYFIPVSVSLSLARTLLKSWLELTPRSFVPLATLKSKVLPIQLAQDTAGS